jgi:hypothetical protein
LEFVCDLVLGAWNFLASFITVHLRFHFLSLRSLRLCGNFTLSCLPQKETGRGLCEARNSPS